MPSMHHRTSDRGFTLVEVLVIAPIVILAISAFIGITITIIGDVIVTRNSTSQVHDATSALEQLDQDLRLTSQFPTTTGALPSPQGRNNNFTGTSAFTSSDDDTLILSTAATDGNPTLSNRRIIYYANQPNACTTNVSPASVVYNRIFYTTNIYFVKDGSLWRRTFVPDFNTTVGSPNANTVCPSAQFSMWQQNTCSPGYSATRCQAQDTKLVDNVADFSVEYFATPDSTTNVGPGAAQTAEAIKVNIVLEGKAAGEEVNTTMSRRMTKMNLVQPVQWRPLVLQNGWGQYNNEYGQPSYTITNTGVVFLRGFITPSTPTPVNGTIIATLPVGYRPSKDTIFPTSTSPTDSGRIDVRADGTVRFIGGSTTSWSSLDNIHFLADVSPYTLSDLTLQNGWAHYDTIRHLQAGVDGAGRTHVRGLIEPTTTAATTSGITIASFPTSMRSEDKYYFFTGVGGGVDYAYYGVRAAAGLRFRAPSTLNWLAVQSIFYPASFTGWSDLSMGTDWIPFSTDYPNPQYTKSSDGVVTVRGLVKDGSAASGTVIGTLPPDYRPGSTRAFNVTGAGNYARINVYSNGNIVVRHLTSSSWVSLNDITFIAGY